MYFVSWLLIDKYNIVVLKVEGSIKKYRVIYEQAIFIKIFSHMTKETSKRCIHLIYIYIYICFPHQTKNCIFWILWREIFLKILKCAWFFNKLFFNWIALSVIMANEMSTLVSHDIFVVILMQWVLYCVEEMFKQEFTYIVLTFCSAYGIWHLKCLDRNIFTNK